MEPTRPSPDASARRWTAIASIVLVAGAALIAVIASGAANAETQAAPVNNSLPTISGTPVVGETLNSTSGSWTDDPTYAYQWRRCNSGGSSCSDLGGSTGSIHTVNSGDVGKTLRIQVTATNSDGTAQATSAPTAVVTSEAKPENTSDPRISGSAVQGQTLTTTSGGWSNSPTDFDYQWVRCGTDGGNPNGTNCGTVPGATGSSYKLDNDDVGRRMRVQVTAQNSAGSTLAASDPTSVVQSSTAVGKPDNTKEPSISGTARQGSTLTASAGSWTGAQPITYAYQWLRCPSNGGKPDGSSCATLGGATSTKYVATAGDVGHQIRVRVTARNSQGSETHASNGVGPVAASGPALPPGAIKLPNGKYSIPASSVSLPARLVIDGIQFTPKVVTTRNTTIQLRVHVSDTRGFYIRDALVFGRSTPLVTDPVVKEPRTGQDGWVTLQFRPERDFPIKRGYSVQFFVRAREQADPILAGVSTRRLVQVRTNPAH